MPAPLKKHYTYADALSWEESDRTELIKGVPFMMSPPSRKHQEISWAICQQLGRYLEGKKCRAYHAPFGVRLFEKDGDSPTTVDTLVEPDIVIVCDYEKLDDEGCKGAPDLIMEILSPSTQRHDKVTKFILYQQAGVREYWIIDPDTQIVQVYTLEDGCYHAGTAYTANSTVPVGIFENFSIDLGQVFTL